MELERIGKGSGDLIPLAPSFLDYEGRATALEQEKQESKAGIEKGSRI